MSWREEIIERNENRKDGPFRVYIKFLDSEKNVPVETLFPVYRAVMEWCEKHGDPKYVFEVRNKYDEFVAWSLTIGP